MISSVRTAGGLCLFGALTGAAGGLALAFIDPVVSDDRWSYPLTPGGFVVTQSVFLLNHLLLLVGLLALSRSGAVGDSRFGLRTAIVGMAGLAGCEIAAAALANSAYPSPETNVLGALYGVTTTLIGVGMIAAGIAVRRAGVWTGWQRYIVLVCGIAVFVMVFPGLASGFLAARLVLTAWMFMWAAIGVALMMHQVGTAHPYPSAQLSVR